MPPREFSQPDLSMLLDAVQDASPVDAVAVLALELGTLVGAEEVSFLMADLSGDTLIRFSADPSAPDSATDPGARVPLAGTPHEQALRSQQVIAQDGAAHTSLFAPVTERGDAIGVLEVTLPAGSASKLVRSFVASAAHALAYVVIANRRHTDMYERGQRNVPFTLAAEIQRRLLPPSFTCEAAEFSLAGWLEPASDVGGDTFDYTVEKDALHLSISDARGHTVLAAQLATLAVAALRNGRRVKADVVEQAAAANAAVLADADAEDFVSALLLRVDLATGEVAAVNAGHPSPFIVRDGVVSAVAMEADLPLGMLSETQYRRQTLTLQPGDRLVMVTDGMLERRAAVLDVAEALHDMTGLHPREVVHTFAKAVLGTAGGALEDDATVLCVDWYGQQPGTGTRVARAGASQGRASSR